MIKEPDFVTTNLVTTLCIVNTFMKLSSHWPLIVPGSQADDLCTRNYQNLQLRSKKVKNALKRCT
jgi:hypothetical protein